MSHKLAAGTTHMYYVNSKDFQVSKDKMHFMTQHYSFR